MNPTPFKAPSSAPAFSPSYANQNCPGLRKFHAIEGGLGIGVYGLRRIAGISFGTAEPAPAKAGGRLSTITYPSGKTITYSYDSSGRVSALSTGASSVSYFPFGMSTGWTQANGQLFIREINQDGLPYLNWTLSSPSYQASVAYDTAGRLTTLTETGVTGTRTFGYDPGNRLTSFTTNGATTSYTYDTNGNRTKVTTSAGSTTYNVASSSNRLSSLSGLVNQTDSFDADGHLSGDGTHTLNYDGRGRMTSAVVGGVTTTYLINAFGQRIQKTGSGVPNGGANEYLYDEAGHLLGEYNSTGGIIDEIVWLPDTPESELLDGSRFGKNGVAAPVAILEGSGGAMVYSVEPDWLNAPYVIANSSKTPVWIWDLVAFGDNAPNQNPSGLGVFTFNPRFPGQYADSETGFSDNWNRTYSSGEGQYIQSDPIGLASGSMSTYAYTKNNPVGRIDRKGLQEAEPDLLDPYSDPNDPNIMFDPTDQRGWSSNYYRPYYAHDTAEPLLDPTNPDVQETLRAYSDYLHHATEFGEQSFEQYVDQYLSSTPSTVVNSCSPSNPNGVVQEQILTNPKYH